MTSHDFETHRCEGPDKLLIEENEKLRSLVADMYEHYPIDEHIEGFERRMLKLGIPTLDNDPWDGAIHGN